MKEREPSRKEKQGYITLQPSFWMLGGGLGSEPARGEALCLGQPPLTGAEPAGDDRNRSALPPRRSSLLATDPGKHVQLLLLYAR